jgi:hypothetical protein
VTGDAGPLDPGDAVRAELVAIEGGWARAIVPGDAGRIAGFMAADWVLVSDSGVTSAEHFLAVIRSGELTHSEMVRPGRAGSGPTVIPRSLRPG